MKKYTKKNISEAQLEELVRRQPNSIEEGLKYMDHQMHTSGGRLDVLLVDSGRALVVAELKVVPDDGMLVQGLDYYDYVTTQLESIARLYKDHSIDPTQPVRLLLIAPDFSQALINRCKWIEPRVSLFSYTCLQFEGEEDLVPIFAEREVPEPPEAIQITRVEDHLKYITDKDIRTRVSSLLEEVKGWKPGAILIDPIKYSISIKVNNRVFAYLSARRQFFVISTYDAGDLWRDFSVKSDEDLSNIKLTMKAAMERRIGNPPLSPTIATPPA
ncbi:MAG: hypothetical protein ACLQHF_14185 [Terracidiphilus sp.]